MAALKTMFAQSGGPIFPEAGPSQHTAAAGGGAAQPPAAATTTTTTNTLAPPPAVNELQALQGNLEALMASWSQLAAGAAPIYPQHGGAAAAAAGSGMDAQVAAVMSDIAAMKAKLGEGDEAESAHILAQVMWGHYACMGWWAGA
jgi:hypothetical protein